MIPQVVQSLERQGWAHVAGGSRAAFDDIARALGKVFYVTDIRLEEGATQFAFRPESFPLHMDSPDARYVGWFVVDSDNSACPLVVADSRPAMRALPQSELRVLREVTTTYQDVKNDALSPVPLVSIDGEGTPVASYFPTNVRAIAPRSAAEARSILAFERMLLTLPKTRIDLHDNDIVVLDNHRMLHGRGPMPPNSRRHMLRYWIEP
jgi:alpha-ketoglutarate-dependent taurine dioxygenase